MKVLRTACGIGKKDWKSPCFAAGIDATLKGSPIVSVLLNSCNALSGSYDRNNCFLMGTKALDTEEARLITRSCNDSECFAEGLQFVGEQQAEVSDIGYKLGLLAIASGCGAIPGFYDRKNCFGEGTRTLVETPNLFLIIGNMCGVANSSVCFEEAIREVTTVRSTTMTFLASICAKESGSYDRINCYKNGFAEITKTPKLYW